MNTQTLYYDETLVQFFYIANNILGATVGHACDQSKTSV